MKNWQLARAPTSIRHYKWLICTILHLRRNDWRVFFFIWVTVGLENALGECQYNEELMPFWKEK